MNKYIVVVHHEVNNKIYNCGIFHGDSMSEAKQKAISAFRRYSSAVFKVYPIDDCYDGWSYFS